MTDQLGVTLGCATTGFQRAARNPSRPLRCCSTSSGSVKLERLFAARHRHLQADQRHLLDARFAWLSRLGGINDPLNLPLMHGHR